MITAELITELEVKGTLKVLLESGLISTHHVFYHEIYYQVKHRIDTGMAKMQVYSEFSERYGVHEDTIRNAYRAMTREVNSKECKEVNQ